MNLLPSLDNEFNIIDGNYIKALNFCLANSSKGKCKEFYEDIIASESSGYKICPFGMTCYVNENKTVYTGFRDRTFYNKKKAKSIENCDGTISYNPSLNHSQFVDLINCSTDISDARITQDEKNSAKNTHEIKKLNGQIIECCNVLFTLLDNDVTVNETLIDSVQQKIKSIYVNSQMVKARYSISDYENNSYALNLGRPFRNSVYKKFDKMRKIFSNSNTTNGAIRLVGSSYKNIDMYSSFELLPFLLVDNAVKYSIPGQEITISFQDYKDSLEVTIDSYGPFCPPSELSRIFENGFRGSNAANVTDGSGIGLFFAKQLCDTYNIDISAESNNTKKSMINGVPYSQFSVKLLFNDCT